MMENQHEEFLRQIGKAYMTLVPIRYRGQKAIIVAVQLLPARVLNITVGLYTQ